MQQAEKDKLFSDIDNLALSACKIMDDQEREVYFTYQENRQASGEALPTKYPVPVRTYYKGENKGKIKRVFEVDGKIFIQLWDKLYHYAVKSAMSSHRSQHYNNADVQSDVDDIRYQAFYVLRYFGPRPNGIRFSQFYVLIVSNILTTSARRRGVFREVSDFVDWFDNHKFDDCYYNKFQDIMLNSSRKVPYIDWMFNCYLNLYFAKDKTKILKALKAHEKKTVRDRKKHLQSKSKELFIAQPFHYNVGNCLSTMINYNVDSLYDEVTNDSDTVSFRIDTIKGKAEDIPDNQLEFDTALMCDINESVKSLTDLSKAEKALLETFLRLYYKTAEPVSLADVAKHHSISYREAHTLVTRLERKGHLVNNSDKRITTEELAKQYNVSINNIGKAFRGLVPALQ